MGIKLGKWSSIFISLVVTTSTMFLFQNCSKEELNLSGRAQQGADQATCESLEGLASDSGCQIVALLTDPVPIWSDHTAVISSTSGDYALDITATENAEAVCKFHFGESSSLVTFTDEDLGVPGGSYYAYASDSVVGVAVAVQGTSALKDQILNDAGEFTAIPAPELTCNPCRLLTTVTCRNLN